jgi:O-antigen/teichoic acid export membrane protein
MRAKNMTSIRQTSRNLRNVLSGELLLRVANIGVAVLIGRVYGAAVLGIYAAIIASATLAERLSDDGMELAGIEEVSKEPAHASRIVTALYIDKTILSSLAILALVGVASLGKPSAASRVMAVILTARTFLYSYCRLHAGVLKALEKTGGLLRIQSAHFGLLVSALLLVYFRGASLVTLLLCLLAAQTFEFLATALLLERHGLRPAKVTRKLCRSLLYRSTPIGLTYTFSTIMLRGDVLVPSLLLPVATLGSLVAADTGLVMVYVVAWLFSGVLLADLGRAAGNRELFDTHFRRCITVLSQIAIPSSVASFFLIPAAIRVLFGKNFTAAGQPGAIMAAAIPFIFLNAAYLSRAVARNASKVCLTIYGVTAILSLALNWILGSGYGVTGIACSIVIREALMTAGFASFGKLSSTARDFPIAISGESELPTC